jgi:uncharacterized membrane protein
MWFREIKRSAVVGIAIALATGFGGGAVAHANDIASQTLVYAAYNGQSRAAEVFKTMQSAQGETGEHIESFAVVSKDAKGKVTVHDQRHRDAGVGAVVGAVIGVVGGPLGVAVGAGVGGAAGYLTGDAVGIPLDKVESMKKALTPNSSALVVVLDDRWVNGVERDMRQAKARQIIASQIGVR